MSEALTTITTDASVTPTTTHITISAGMNAIRVFTGEQVSTEPWFYLYARVNGGTAKKIQLTHWQARIIRMELEEGDEVAFGTSDGRNITACQTAVPASFDAFTGFEKTIAIDTNLPPIWEPAASHIILPSDSSSFVIKAGASKKHIFIREYDTGTSTWTPARWVMQSTVKDIHVRCTYRQIAIATRSTATLDVILPIGTTYAGTSVDASLTMPTEVGTPYTATTSAEFLSACAAVVKGVRNTIIVSNSITLSAAVTESTFTANVAAGNSGMSGIVIRSADNDPTNTVLSWTTASHAMYILQSSASGNLAGFKGLGFDRTSSTASFGFRGGRWAIWNCRFTGVTGDVNTDACRFVSEASSSIIIDFLDCVGTGTTGDTFSGGSGGNHATSQVRFIRCSGTTSGTANSLQALTTHQGLAVKSYGCTWTKTAALENAIAPDSSSVISCFFDTITGRVLNTDMFNCFQSTPSTVASDYGMAYPKQFAIYNHITSAANVTAVAWVLHTTGTVTARTVPMDHNIFAPTGTGWRFIRTWVGGYRSFGNLSVGASGVAATAMYADIYTGSNTENTTLWNATSILNGSIFLGSSSFKGNVRNIACTHTSNALVPNDAATNTAMTGKGYSTLQVQSNSYSLGTSDSVAVPALGDDYFPTPSGNLDGTGDASVIDWYGGSDAWGFVFRRGETLSRGAREYPAIASTDTIHPDLFFATVTTVDEPRGGIMSTSRGLGMGLGIDIL